MGRTIAFFAFFPIVEITPEDFPTPEWKKNNVALHHEFRLVRIPLDPLSLYHGGVL